MSRSPCSAVSAAVPTAPACSKLTSAGLLHDRALRFDRDVLGPGAASPAQHLVTGLEAPSRPCPPTSTTPGVVDAEADVSRTPKPRRRTSDPRPADDGIPLGDVHRRRADTDEHLVVGRLGLGELADLDDLRRRAEPVAHCGSHRVASFSSYKTVSTTLPVFCPVSTYLVASTTSSSRIRPVDDRPILAGLDELLHVGGRPPSCTSGSGASRACCRRGASRGRASGTCHMKPRSVSR